MLKRYDSVFIQYNVANGSQAMGYGCFLRDGSTRDLLIKFSEKLHVGSTGGLNTQYINKRYCFKIVNSKEYAWSTKYCLF